MTNSNENELKVGDVISDLMEISNCIDKGYKLHDQNNTDIKNAINLIKQQAEQLESARKEVDRLNRIKSGVIDDLTRLVEAQEYQGLHHEYQDGKATAYTHCIDMLSIDDYVEAPKPEDKQS